MTNKVWYFYYTERAMTTDKDCITYFNTL